MRCVEVHSLIFRKQSTKGFTYRWFHFLSSKTSQLVILLTLYMYLCKISDEDFIEHFSLSFYYLFGRLCVFVVQRKIKRVLETDWVQSTRVLIVCLWCSIFNVMYTDTCTISGKLHLSTQQGGGVSFTILQVTRVTLTTGAKTPTTDRSKNRIKIRNKYFTYGLSNRLFVSVKVRALRCANLTNLGF